MSLSQKKMLFVHSSLLDVGLMPNDLALLVALSAFSNLENESWPTVSTLAQKCRMSESSVRRSLKVLVSKKLLTITGQKRDDGTDRASLYTIVFNRVSHRQGIKHNGMLSKSPRITEKSAIYRVSHRHPIKHGDLSANTEKSSQSSISDRVSHRQPRVSHRQGEGVTQTPQEVYPLEVNPIEVEKINSKDLKNTQNQILKNLDSNPKENPSSFEGKTPRSKIAQDAYQTHAGENIPGGAAKGRGDGTESVSEPIASASSTSKNLAIVPVTPKPRPRDPFFDALALAWLGTTEGLNNSHGGQIAKAKTQMARAGFTQDDVPKIAEYLKRRDHWKTAPPTPAQIAQAAPQWRTNAGRAPPIRGKPRTVDDANQKLLSHAQRLLEGMNRRNPENE